MTDFVAQCGVGGTGLTKGELVFFFIFLALLSIGVLRLMCLDRDCYDAHHGRDSHSLQNTNHPEHIEPVLHYAGLLRLNHTEHESLLDRRELRQEENQIEDERVVISDSEHSDESIHAPGHINNPGLEDQNVRK